MLMGMAMQAPRTEFAANGLQISDLIAVKFENRAFGGIGRTVELCAPDGPSTGGGRRSRQSFVLRGADPELRPIVFGWFDVVERECELRNFALVSQQFERRHGQPIDLDEPTYEGLVEEVRDFLALQGVSRSIREPSVAPVVQEAPPPPVVEPQPSLAPMLFAAVMVLVSAIAGYVVIGI